MNITIPHTKDKIFRLILLVACFLFAGVSCVVFLFLASFSQALLCLVCALCMLIPDVLERVFKMRAPTLLYSFVLLYACGPMLGYSYKLYYIIPWWDTLLHTCGGVAFAILGAYLPCLLDRKRKPSLLLCAVFGFCFSVTISAIWEFIEYGLDTFFGMDMQSDRFINSLNSYLLGEGLGISGSIPNIESVIVNGQPLEGYIDIGLFDTMKDMLVETLGALVYTVIFIVDKGEHCGLKHMESPKMEVIENTKE